MLILKFSMAYSRKNNINEIYISVSTLTLILQLELLKNDDRDLKKLPASNGNDVFPVLC